MSVREFVDTNLLIYAHDRTATSKRPVANRLIHRLWASGGGCLSVQVLQEFYVNCTRKLGLSTREAEAQVDHLSAWRVHSPAAADVIGAIHLHRRHGISFWDAMIVQSASRLGCEILWTEDLNAEQEFEGVRVKNPFANG